MDLLAVPADRLDPRIEAVAYLIVARVVTGARAGRTSVESRRVGDHLVVDVVSDWDDSRGRQDLEDRVGALDGYVRVASADGRIHLHAEIPCAS
jgi:hypothetical protein